jgi:hypothetical protein
MLPVYPKSRNNIHHDRNLEQVVDWHLKGGPF